MYSLNCLIDSNRISKNTPILFTTTAALGLFFIGVLILSLTGLGVISTTGYIIGTVALLFGLTGLVLLFCFLLKKKKLSTPPPKPSSQTPEIRTPSPQKILPPETIKPRKFDTPLYAVDLTKIQKTLEVPIKGPGELDLEYQQPFFYLFEKLEERVSDYLSRNLISEEKLLKEEFINWRASSDTGRVFESFKIAIESTKVYPLKGLRIFAFYLLGLSKKMEEGILSEEVCIEICKNLLRVTLHCSAAWVEAAERLYYRYCLGIDDLEKALHSNLSEIKKNMCEACLFTCYQTTSGPLDVLHVYNRIANSDFGKTWGLSSLGTAADRSGWSVSNATIEALAIRFEELLNPEFLIDSMHAQINQTYNDVYYNVLVSSIKPEELQPNQTSADFVAEHFYSEDYILNKDGVTRLLLSSGWLVNSLKQ